MGKQQEQQKDKAPYATYSIDEFERLASLGIWPGANVAGIGYVHQGRSIPKYLQVYLSSRRETEFLKKAGDIAGYTGIAGGLLERTEFGSIRFFKGGQISPAYYKYLERTGRGWTGGTGAEIKTWQVSTQELRVGARFVGNIAGVAGIGISGYSGYLALKAKNSSAFKKSGIDVAMGIVGFLGTPGFIISSMYFIIDPLGEPSSSETKLGEQTPIDNLKINKKIMTLDEQEQMRIRQLNKIERPVLNVNSK